MTYHVQLSISGALKNWKSGDGKAYNRTDGPPMTDEEAHNRLVDLLAAGVQFLPVGPKCDGWTPQHGCPGHDDASE